MPYLLRFCASVCSHLAFGVGNVTTRFRQFCTVIARIRKTIQLQFIANTSAYKEFAGVSTLNLWVRLYFSAQNWYFDQLLV